MERTPAAERELVERAKSDREAFGALYEQYAPRIQRYLYYRLGDRAEAEELTSRVFLRALDHLGEFEAGSGSFAGWLFTIAHNLVANWFRDTARRRTDTLEAVTESAGLGDALSAIDDAEVLRSAVAHLTAERQHLVLLRYIEGLSHAEIGRVMGKSEGAVRALLHRTLRDLRTELEGPMVRPPAA